MLNRSVSLTISTSTLKALPCKLDMKRHSPSILYIWYSRKKKYQFKLTLMLLLFILKMSAAYIHLHFRLGSILEASPMNHCVQSDLGAYCLHYRLPKNISRGEEQTTNIVTGGKVFIAQKA